MRNGSAGLVQVWVRRQRNVGVLVAVIAAFLVLVMASARPALASGDDQSQQNGNHSRGRKYKAPPPMASVEVTVLRDGSDKPVQNAAVVFQPVINGKDKGGMELKTNEEGKAKLDVIELNSTMRLQVIAKGFQTYGQDYSVDIAEKTIVVKLKRPQEQYSVYKDHPEEHKDESATPSTQAPK